jgi:hypothetical protein
MFKGILTVRARLFDSCLHFCDILSLSCVLCGNIFYRGTFCVLGFITFDFTLPFGSFLVL